MLRLCPSRHALLWPARLALALTALLAAAGCSTSPTTTLRSTPTVVPTPAPPLSVPHMVPTLTGISLVSSDAVWIVGRDGYYNGIGAFLLGYHNGGWRLEAFPPVVDAKLATPTSIAMVTADTGWIAATMAPGYSPVILHENSGSWLVDKLPPSAGIVTALSATAPLDAWALSTSVDLLSGAPTTTILRYGDGQWTAEATFRNTSLTALSMDSADDGWAVGSDAAGPVLLHYTNGAWASMAPAASSGITGMTGVFMASPSVGWATGITAPVASTCTDCGAGGQQRVVFRFQSGDWQQVREADGGAEDLPYTFTSSEQLLPDSVAAGSEGSGWVARKQLVYFAPDGRQRVWSATCKTDFLGMALVPAPSPSAAPEGWVIGSNGQLFHLTGGTLTRYNTGAACDPLVS
jgi:hypothetical protein